MNNNEEFWNTCDNLNFSNESDVETRLILPMLAALGYDYKEDIASKFPINFKVYEGRRGRKPEADYVVFASLPHTRATSLITIEAKHPSEKLADGKMQAESYAQNLRTPFIFFCNGLNAQLWQLQTSTECKLIFEVLDGKYLSSRTQFESFLSKEAGISHCKKLEYKDFNLSLRDYSNYELAELKRLNSTEPRITRMLHHLGDKKSEPKAVSELVQSDNCAVIVAKSGFGKSVLSKQICTEALELRLEKISAPLPVEVTLPELAASGTNLLQFVTERISAHMPAITPSSLSRLVNEEGLLLVADGLNRVSHSQQLEIISNLNTLQRDYPKMRMIVLTNNMPDTDISNATPFELKEFDKNDLESIATLNNLPLMIWSGVPEVINQMVKIPILAAKIVDEYKSKGRYFQRIDEIFERWLQIGLAGIGQIDRAILQQALEDIASVTRERSISLSELHDLLQTSNSDLGLYEKLIATGLVVIDGKSVELVHETLATYLRALALIERPSAEIRNYLKNHGDQENYLFSSVLMAVVPSRTIQNIVWNGILEKSLTQAVGALQYRPDLTGQFETQSQMDMSLTYLSDVHQAIVELTKLFFSSYAEKIYEEISGYLTNDIGIVGNVAEQWASYSFFDAKAQSEKIIIDDTRQTNNRKSFGENLRLQGLRSDSGRLIGLKLFKATVQKICDKRQIRGGRVYLEERCLGRFRYLAQAFNYSTLMGNVDLLSAINLLSPEKNSFASNSYEDSAIPFQISELIEDLKELVKRGVSTISPWWTLQSEIDLNSDIEKEQYISMVDTYYARSQALYFEFVSSLPELQQYMRGMQNRPHRYTVRVRTSDERDYVMIWDKSSLPVSDLTEAGADVYFDDDKDGMNPWDDPDGFANEYKTKLVSLGRMNDDWSYSWSSGIAPDFLGRDSSFGKVRYETAAMSLAMKWFKEDIAYIFRELPSTDTGFLQA